MSDDKITLEVDKKIIEDLYGLMDQSAPEAPDSKGLKELVFCIKEKLKTLESNIDLSAFQDAETPTPTPAPTTSTPTVTAPSQPITPKINAPDRPKTILVVDDLGVITYQLKSIFTKVGFDVDVCHEINEAIEQYKTKDYGYIVIDLFIPTEREGFMLLDEIKKLSLLCNLNTKILVMTASSKEEYKVSCKNHGADAYIEKIAGWQKELLDNCLND